MKFAPHTYQSRAIDFVMTHTHCALFLDMGLGKTVSTLTALDRLMFEEAAVERVLVIAPKSVALNTWSGETRKWDHLNHLRISVMLGSLKQRLAALNAQADIYVINRENVVWLTEYFLNAGLAWPFDTVVIDESSSFKNYASKRFKALWKMRPQIRRIIELTGTPAPNGLIDLWSQVKLLDGGERLGKFIGQYRESFFHPGARSGAVVYDWLPNSGAQDRIAAKIGDICLSMQASDYLEMPMVIDGGMTLQLDELKQYRKFEKELLLDLDDGGEIMALTAVSLTNKLLQFSSGAVYDTEHDWHEVSRTKLEAFSELMEASTEPVLVFYNYQHEKERILSEFPDAVPFKGEPEILTQWNEGKIHLLLCHPASVAYGLNMQQGGHIIVWYSPTWNLELYQQANARLHRQGQTKPVVIYHLVCKDTMDEVVMAALHGKGDTQAALMQYLKQLKATIA